MERIDQTGKGQANLDSVQNSKIVYHRGRRYHVVPKPALPSFGEHPCLSPPQGQSTIGVEPLPKIGAVFKPSPLRTMQKPAILGPSEIRVIASSPIRKVNSGPPDVFKRVLQKDGHLSPYSVLPQIVRASSAPTKLGPQPASTTTKKSLPSLGASAIPVFSLGGLSQGESLALKYITAFIVKSRRDPERVVKVEVILSDEEKVGLKVNIKHSESDALDTHFFLTSTFSKKRQALALIFGNFLTTYDYENASNTSIYYFKRAACMIA